MNRLRLITLALLCLPAVTESIQACQCREYGTPICAQFWRSDAVFVGQAVDIKPLKNKPDNVYTYVMVRFRIQESFRGVSGPMVSIGRATTMCDTKFKRGKRYLVYASFDKETNQFFTEMCTGSSVQRSLNSLTTQLARGNLNPGIGTKNLFGNVFYARARDGHEYFLEERGTKSRYLQQLVRRTRLQ